uniref:Disease resistance N-terminal domain-containing protein n=1 Tax=Aegilops tauschii subsp. strangulata TaxID=200361 RepID=A0A453MJM8_AEGTS
QAPTRETSIIASRGHPSIHPSMEAVVSASHGVMGPLLGKLADLLAGKYGRIRGVRGEILSLQAELTSMHAALKNYTMLEDPDVQVKAWISLLRELAYDTEDTMLENCKASCGPPVI